MTELFPMDKLATEAAKLNTRPTKDAAYNALGDLVEKLDDLPPELAVLYAYFLPPLPKKAETAEQWVCRALSKKKDDGCLQYAYSDGKYFYGSDRYRYHVAKLNKVEGFYDRMGRRVQLDAKYPRISAHLSNLPEKSYHIELKSLPVIAIEKGHVYELPTGHYVRKEYLLSCVDKIGGYKIVGNQDHAMIIVQHEFGQAILLPIKVLS